MATQEKQSDIKDEQESGIGENAGATNSTDNDISASELELLDNAGIGESDDEDEMNGALLDDTDEDGEKLNQDIDLTGDDLDVPGSETDDENELIGEEDEENNSYSTRDQDDLEDDEDVL